MRRRILKLRRRISKMRRRIFIHKMRRRTFFMKCVDAYYCGQARIHNYPVVTFISLLLPRCPSNSVLFYLYPTTFNYALAHNKPISVNLDIFGYSQFLPPVIDYVPMHNIMFFFLRCSIFINDRIIYTTDV